MRTFGHAIGADKSAGFIYCVLGRVEYRQAWSEMSELFRSRAVEGRSVGN